MNSLVKLVLLAGASLGLCSAALAGPRVASLNLCADQYILALAEPEQILSLSPDAHDRVLSHAAIKARNFPITNGSAEAIAAYGPDIVFANPYGRDGTKSLLQGLGITVIELEVAQDFEAIKRQTRIVAQALEQSARGEALITDMERRLTSTHQDGPRPVAVNLQRRGFIAGAGTLVDAAMTAAGFDNLARKISGDAVRQVSLEELLIHKPDFIVLNQTLTRAEDWGTILLEHPALTSLYPPAKRLMLESHYTVCGGPAFPDAVDRLRSQFNARRN